MESWEASNPFDEFAKEKSYAATPESIQISNLFDVSEEVDLDIVQDLLDPMLQEHNDIIETGPEFTEKMDKGNLMTCNVDSDAKKGNQVDTVDSCIEIIDSSSDSEEDCESDICDFDCTILPLVLTQADDVCIKLNNLIDKGVISKDRIFYKFLKDAVYSLIDVYHQYDREVIEFYNTIEHLGGESVVNFIRGPMYFGTGK
eukprot:Seg1934.2 transcript_id=Seg1934.2/GoldUCD/mRNA.D3Y31 product="hypothetical protein" protein_id=Seg1934.2/GoldUCD/D3Y31